MRAYVHGYFGSEGYLPSALLELHLPSLEVSMLVNFAAPHLMLHPLNPSRVIERRNAWVVGLQSRHLLSTAVGPREFMAVRFTPVGAHLALNLPMDQVTNRAVDLEDIDARFARRLMNQLRRATDWEARFHLAELLIAERLATAPQPSALVRRAWKRIQDGPSDLRLAQLCRELECSRRHLIAQFHEEVGVAPKMVVRIARFNRALGSVDRSRPGGAAHFSGKPYLDLRSDWSFRDAQVRWAELALAGGYYDQSHFIKEFSAFSGMTPAEFLRQTRPDETRMLE